MEARGELAGGGPSIGPVSFPIGSSGVDGTVPYWKVVNKLHVKLPLLIDAPAGSTVELAGIRRSDGEEARFAYLDIAPDWAMAIARPMFALPDRGQSDQRPADVPGVFIAPGPGCYQLTVTVNSIPFGPFGIYLKP